MIQDSKNKPIIALDFDDVLVDVTKGFIKFYKDRGVFNVDYEKIEKDIYPLIEITEEEELKLWDKFFESGEYMALSPSAQTLEALDRLKERFELIIITNRVDRFRGSVLAWIEKRVPNYFSKIIFARDFPEGNRSKGKICADLGVVLLVDDEPKNILSCIERRVPILVYDNPWNRKLPAGLPRIKSFEELYKFVK